MQLMMISLLLSCANLTAKPSLPVIKASFFRGTARPTVGATRTDSITSSNSSNPAHGNGNGGPMILLVMPIMQELVMSGTFDSTYSDLDRTPLNDSTWLAQSYELRK